MKKVLFGIIALLIALPMVSTAASTKAATKYPIVLSHGMGANAEVFGFADYWGDIPEALKNNGANVFITSGNPMQSKEYKGIEWKTKVLEILAITGKEKINLIGHSDGGLYTRYAITHLGMASKVASFTSMSSPHRGSPVANAIMNIGDATSLTDEIAGVLDYVYIFLGVPGTDCATNGYQETTTYMINVFNPNTPDVAGVYYQSYAANAKTAIGGQIMTPLWLAMKLAGYGANDGLVSVSSAKWGNYKGEITGWFGVNHMALVGLMSLPTPGYDAPTFFVNIAADLKSKGF